MRFVFAIALVLHGFIHLLGFINVFLLTDIDKKALGIPKPIGAIWLLVFILFITTSVAFLNNRKWFYFAFVAIMISQILIVIAWKEAKFGTILNLVFLIVSVVSFSTYRFKNMIAKEKVALVLNKKTSFNAAVNEDTFYSLPAIVKQWLTNSGALNTKSIQSVSLQQIGKMRIKPKGKWMPFTANQYFDINNPAFIWTTEVQFMPFIKLYGRDKLVNANGEMLIKLAALIPVVNEENKKITQGAMLRFLAEMCWFPQAATKDYIQWETIDSTSAKATLTINDEHVSGIFKFNTIGEIQSFEANRYYGGKTDSQLKIWTIETREHKIFNGIKTPNKCNVTWKLDDGDFKWLTLEIVDLNYFNSK